MRHAPESSSPVAVVRAFNRFYTQVIGVLAPQHLGTGMTLGQARVLFEIGQRAPAADVAALRSDLGVDGGYLSRTLSELERAKLVARRTSRADRRAREVTLTAAGRRALRALDRRSDAAAAGLVEPLPPESRRRLVAAMQEIERLLGDDVSIEAAPADGADARACLRAYYAELAERLPEGFDPEASESAHAREVSPPRGAFLVVYQRGRALGCGAVKRLAPGLGEIKRMWIDGRLRGRGVGRRLLAALEAEAAALGHHTVRLDTAGELREAIALYLGAGYREIAPYNDNPYATRWFEKRLAGARPPRAARGRS